MKDKVRLLFIAFRMGRCLIDYAKAKNPNERNALAKFFREWEESELKSE